MSPYSPICPHCGETMTDIERFEPPQRGDPPPASSWFVRCANCRSSTYVGPGSTWTNDPRGRQG